MNKKIGLIVWGNYYSFRRVFALSKLNVNKESALAGKEMVTITHRKGETRFLKIQKELLF